MPLFQVIAHNHTTSFNQAVVEIEADTPEEAQRLAAERNADGQLPWERESEEQDEPTDYEVMEVGVREFGVDEERRLAGGPS